MSLTRLVTDLINERGSGTVDDLMPELEEYTRRQVIDALAWARHMGLIVCDGPGPRRSKGRGGSLPGTYRAIERPALAPVSSVWQFADRMAA